MRRSIIWACFGCDGRVVCVKRLILVNQAPASIDLVNLLSLINIGRAPWLINASITLFNLHPFKWAWKRCYLQRRLQLIFRRRYKQTDETSTILPYLEPRMETDTSIPSLSKFKTCVNESEQLLPLVNTDREPPSLRKVTTMCRGLLTDLSVMSVNQIREPVKLGDLDVTENQPQPIVYELLTILKEFRDCIAFSVFERYRSVNHRKTGSDTSESIRYNNFAYVSQVMLVEKKWWEKRSSSI